jgi:hypothetical protein
MALAAHLAVQRNPFSTATTTAKVCDGLVSASVAERCQFSFIVKCPSDTATILLHPSYTGPVHVRNSDLVQTQTSAAGVTPVTYTTTLSPVLNYHFNTPDHCYRQTWSSTDANAANLPALLTSTATTEIQGVQYAETEMNFVAATGGTAAPDSTNESANANTKILRMQRNAFSPDRFRVVSSGMRLTAINNAEANNGWFEAIRITPSYEPSEFLTYKTSDGDGTTAKITYAFAPDPLEFMSGVMSSTSNWANYPGYVTGKLRDIGKHMFYLQTVGDRSFKLLDQDFEVKGGSMTADFTRNVVQLRDSPGPMQSYDTSFDCVLVRIHSLPATTIANQTQVHCHTVINYEAMYDPVSPLSRFQSTTVSAASAVAAVDRAIKRDSKPSIIRQSSSLRYAPMS